MTKNFLIGLARGVAIFVTVALLLCAALFFIFPLPGHIPVLMYHFIVSKEATETNGNVISADTFKKQMNYLKHFGFHVITLEEYDAIRSGLRQPQGKQVVLTFDDGSVSVPEKALPILSSMNFPATLFLISENLKSGDYGSIKTDAARQLAKNNPLISYGAHSRTHPFLSQISDDDVIKEVVDSKTELESMLGMPIQYFAYPYGDFDERSLNAAKKAGYRLAFTTSPKKLRNFKLSDYCVPRVKITESASDPFVFWIKVSGIYESYKLLRHRRYQKKLSQETTL